MGLVTDLQIVMRLLEMQLMTKNLVILGSVQMEEVPQGGWKEGIVETTLQDVSNANEEDLEVDPESILHTVIEIPIEIEIVVIAIEIAIEILIARETRNVIVIEMLLIVIEITRNVVIETLIVIGVNDHHEEIVRDHEIGIVIEEDRDHLVTANHPVVVINIRKVNAKREINLIVKLRKKSKRNQMTTLNNCCSEKDLFFS